MKSLILALLLLPGIASAQAYTAAQESQTGVRK